MQQFTVPQFITVEDKIIGPITTRQFLIMVVAFLLSVLFFRLFDFGLFLTLTLLNFGTSAVLAFVKINGRPFHFFLLNIFETFTRPKIRVWNNEFTAIEAGEEFLDIENKASGRKILLPYDYKYKAKSRLTELALIVDTGGRYKGEERADRIKIKPV